MHQENLSGNKAPSHMNFGAASYAHIPSAVGVSGPDSPVQEALNALGNLTRDTHEMLTFLLTRLEPVMGPRSSGQTSADSPRSVGECRIEESIMSQAELVRGLFLRIQDARDSLRI